MSMSEQMGRIERRSPDRAGHCGRSGWQGAPARVRICAARYFGDWAADQMGCCGQARKDYAEGIACNPDPVYQVRRDLRQEGFAPGLEALQDLYADFLHAAEAECGPAPGL